MDQAIEPRPGNPAVVHHILMFVIPPDGRPNSDLGGDDDFLGAYARDCAEPLPPGMARMRQSRLEADFQMHYTPNGIGRQDRSYSGSSSPIPRQ